MPISLVQQGDVAEYLFVVVNVLTSDGELEVSRQATDDDRRDADVHRRSDFLLNLGFQIKCAMHVDHPFAADRLHIRFTVLKDRLVTHPFFFYFFAFLDKRLLRFADPVFIVPSAEVHRHAIPHLHGDTWHFDFDASLAPDAMIGGCPSALIPLTSARRSSRSSRSWRRVNRQAPASPIDCPRASSGYSAPIPGRQSGVKRVSAAA